MGRRVTFPRFTQAYGVDYSYTGQRAHALPFDAAPPQVVDAYETFREPMHDAMPAVAPNSALLNFYETSPQSADYMGPHSDDERSLVAAAPIVSLTWCTQGHRRRFRLLPRPGISDTIVPPQWRHPKVAGLIMSLGNGDLVVMGGDCQRTHKHEVMRAASRDAAERHGRRINMTLRRFHASAANAPATEQSSRKAGGDSLPVESVAKQQRLR